MEVVMKPKIGQIIWTVEQQSAFREWWIIPETVGYLGKTGFVVDGYATKNPSSWEYDEYGKTWFLSLNKAKSYANKKIGKKSKWLYENGGYYSD